MLNPVVRSFAGLLRLPRKPAFGEFCLGILAGVHVLLWLSWFTAAWGVSLTVIATMAGSFGVAALLCRRFDFIADDDPGLSRAGAWCLLSGWTLALPGLLAASFDCIGWTSLDVLERPLVPLSIHVAGGLLLLTPGWIALLQALKRSHAIDQASHHHRSMVSEWVLLGAAGALFLMPATLAVGLDLQSIGWAVSGLGLIISVHIWRRSRNNSTISDLADPPPVAGTSARILWAGDVWVGLLAGLALAITVRITGQLVANAAYMACAQLSGVVGGIAVGMWLRRRFERSASRSQYTPPIAASLVLAFGTSALVVLFPQLTNAVLHVSANVSHTFSVVLLRGGLLAVCLFPCGAAIGLHLADMGIMTGVAAGKRISRTLGITAVAFAVTRAIDVPVALGMTLAVLGAAAAAVADWWLSSPTDRRQPVLVTILTVPMLTALFWSSRFDASRSAGLLFSTQTIQASRTDTPVEHLHLIDDGRLVEAFERDGATWTTWLHAGRQLVVRENGLPRGASSLDPAICPEVSTEMLPAVLPLIIHRAPRKVTLVGAGGTTALSACLAFPVSNVTCIEPRQGLLEVARRCGAEGASRNPFEDPRLRVSCTDPVLASAARQTPQDVIILNRGQAFLWDTCAEFTTDWYRRLADQLAPGGLLCQRLYYGEFGAQPVRDLAATLHTVFPQVILIETGPGELVFIASRDAENIVGADLLDRAGKPHVRALLSRLGWDWSVLLSTATVDAPVVEQLVNPELAQANTMAGSRFMFQLPFEFTRWGAKGEEVNSLLGPHSRQLLSLVDDETGVQDVTLRLADVAEQHRIIEEHPDVFWAYRSSLRRRLQERPRMTIQLVSHEGLDRSLHPEDERRKQFLLALSEAATRSAPAAAALQRLEQFVEPYDPLVSYFVHHELAELYARAETPDREAELTHRLHTVFFGGGRDQSVHNVSEAINLILEQPDVLPEPQRRWDTLNALLNVLMQRWQQRFRAAGTSRFDAADVNSSFNAASAALNAMDQLAPDTTISS